MQNSERSDGVLKDGFRKKLCPPLLALTAVLLIAAAAFGNSPFNEWEHKSFEVWFREPPNTLSQLTGSMAELSDDGALLRVGFPPSCPLYPIAGRDAITSSSFFMKGRLEATPPEDRAAFTAAQNEQFEPHLAFPYRPRMSVGFGPGYNRFDVNAIESRGDTLVIITFPDVSFPKFLFDQDQYAMLIRCSEKGDVSEWNEWMDRHLDEKGKPTIEVRLQGVDFASTNLRGVNLAKARLEGANFYAADLSSADLSGANLRGTNLNATILPWAKLPQANLTGANLTSADLREADLRGTLSYDGVDFRNANTKGARFYASTHITF